MPGSHLMEPNGGPEKNEEQGTAKVSKARTGRKFGTRKLRWVSLRHLALQQTAEMDESVGKMLQELLTHFGNLPKNSCFARHRIKMVKRAMGILERKRKRMSAQEQQDLSSILAQLSIHEPKLEAMRED